MSIKIGDKVVGINYDVSSWRSHQFVNWGYVYYVDGDDVAFARKGYSPTYISLNSDVEKVYIFNPNIKETLHKLIDNYIIEYELKIRKLTIEEKDELVKNRFEEIKQQITNTTKSMIDSKDESEYLNALKEICRLKKQLFSIKISDLDNIHKSNGVVKGKIRLLKELKEKIEKLNFEEE